MMPRGGGSDSFGRGGYDGFDRWLVRGGVRWGRGVGGGGVIRFHDYVDCGGDRSDVVGLQLGVELERSAVRGRGWVGGGVNAKSQATKHRGDHKAISAGRFCIDAQSQGRPVGTMFLIKRC
jgi:hypothetical protein